MTVSRSYRECMLFQFTDRGRFFVALGAGTSVVIFVGVMAVIRDQFDRGAFLLIWLGSWLYVLWGTIFVINNTDILVGDAGLSRVLFGTICQHVSWTEIMVVREYSLFSRAENRLLRCLNIIPKQSSWFKWKLSGKIVVTDKVERFDDLVDVLNSYFCKHPVKIEIKVNERWQHSDKLLRTI